MGSLLGRKVAMERSIASIYNRPSQAASAATEHLGFWKDAVIQRSSRDAFLVAVFTFLVGFVSFTFHIGDFVSAFVDEISRSNFNQFYLANIALAFGLILFGIRRIMELRDEVRRRSLAEHEARRLAFRDPLTLLPNRNSFLNAAKMASSQVDRYGGVIAVVMLRLDRFKLINDRFGRDIGDQALIEFSEKLRKVVRKEEDIARLDATVFGVILHIKNGAHQDALMKAIARLVDDLSAPISVAEARIEIQLAVGVSLYPYDTADIPTLIQCADSALRRTEEENQTGISYYEVSTDEQIRERAELELDIKRAIETQQIKPAYQPIVSLETGDVVGFEILARWHHPQKGLISPDVFVPIAEASGLISQLTISMLTIACTEWRDVPSNAYLALNVSPSDMKDSWFPEKILGELTKTGFPPHRLEIEITENTVVDDVLTTKRAIESLKNQGVKVALDDFGTRHSNLSQLSSLPIDKIKIDKMFVSTMHFNQASLAIIRTIVGLSRVIGATVVAEGIETEDQLETLDALGCDLGQGYLFSKPLLIDQAADQLATAAKPNESMKLAMSA